MPINSTQPTRDELEVAWEDFQSRVFQCFVKLVWIKDVTPCLNGVATRHTKLIANATTESTLLAVRDLDDFFSVSGERDGDMRAIHYSGYRSPGGFLTKPERDSINKKLIHLTYRAVKERMKATENFNPRQWDSADLVERTMKAVVHFLSFLELKFYADDRNRIKDIQAARRGICTYLSELKELARTEREGFGD